MAKFDESKVINALHTDKAEVGKRYWFADHILTLKKVAEGNANNNLYELTGIDKNYDYCFKADDGSEWEFLYPYEEPPKQRMTPQMLSEWLAKGNGQCKHKREHLLCTVYSYYEHKDELDKNIVIRPWDSEEWVEPTVDIYERDCKGR